VIDITIYYQYEATISMQTDELFSRTLSSVNFNSIYLKLISSSNLHKIQNFFG
jgi:hypothetical protein